MAVLFFHNVNWRNKTANAFDAHPQPTLFISEAASTFPWQPLLLNVACKVDRAFLSHFNGEDNSFLFIPCLLTLSIGRHLSITAHIQ